MLNAFGVAVILSVLALAGFLAVTDLIIVSESTWMALQQACSTVCIAWIE